MRKLLKWIFYIFFFSILLTLGTGAVIYWWSQPKIEGKETLEGLQGKVTITRDQYGVSHIVADKSDSDAFFALGYVHAQDRFWQMEFQRRLAQGTLSEILGKDALSVDEYSRTWGFYRAAETAWPALSPQSKQIIEAYTAGVNAYLIHGHKPIQLVLLHYKPQPWTVIDSIVWQKMMAWDLQTIWEMKLKEYVANQMGGSASIEKFFPAYPKDAPIILSDADLKQSGLLGRASSKTLENTFAYLNNDSNEILNTTQAIRDRLHMPNTPDKGSNNWVLSGQWTVTGKPILANDPHLELQAPGVWYLAELKGPHLDVIGATLPGVPGVVIGHNNHIAWGVTNANIDTQELYILKPDEKVRVDKEIIYVKNRPPVIYPVFISDVGPVISGVTSADRINGKVALKWTALLPGDTTVQSLLELDYANNWTDFVNALKDFVVPSQNFVYADTDGNIGYYLPGKIPVRNYASNLPVPDDSQHQWQGYIPFEKLPHVYNPKEGYIVSANNRVVDNAYPYSLTFRWQDPPYRAERIIELLNQQKPLNVNQCAAIQLDTTTLLWKSFAPLLLKTHPLDKPSQYALNQLSKWDGNATLDSVPATIFAYWYRQIGNLTPSSIASLLHWPDPLFLYNELSENGSLCQMSDSGDCADYLSKSLQIAMQKLQNDLGNNPKDWQWGEVHYAVFSALGFGASQQYGPIWTRYISSPGFLYSINVGTFNFSDFNQTNGASYRQIVDLSNFDNSLYIQPLGQSDNVLNANYQNLMPLWRDGKYLRMTTDAASWGKTKQLVLAPPANG